MTSQKIASNQVLSFIFRFLPMHGRHSKECVEIGCDMICCCTRVFCSKEWKQFMFPCCAVQDLGMRYLYIVVGSTNQTKESECTS